MRIKNRIFMYIGVPVRRNYTITEMEAEPGVAMGTLVPELLPEMDASGFVPL
jgi:hypothetical protein